MQTPPNRTMRSVIASTGQSAPAYFTSPLWVTGVNLFAKPTGGNKIEALTTGKAYFADLIKTVDKAEIEVCILGWQVNWDVLLAPGVRLYDLVYRNARRGINFYIMPWRHTNPIQTYDAQTRVVLGTINDRLEDERVDGRGRVEVLSSASQADKNSYFSHHQKMIVVDRKIGYIGGIDLSYGRYDDEKFGLDPTAEGRIGLNSYNPCVPPMQAVRAQDFVQPDLLSGGADQLFGAAANTRRQIMNGGHQVRYKKNTPLNNNNTLEGNWMDLTVLASHQPRLPWQDLHSRVEGPAVSDLLRNFVGRWNALNSSTKLPMPKPVSDLPPAGEASIQVLRSASAKMCAAEYNALTDKKGVAKPGEAQTHIHDAMIRLIERSKRFVYIESQFFVSDFGNINDAGDPGRLSPASRFIQDGPDGISDFLLNRVRNWDDDEGAALDANPVNRVCAALISRCQQSILDLKKSKFHAYITLPVHPEGSLADFMISTQVFWTMQSLVFGSRSLLNGIRRALKARELRDKGDSGHMRVINDDSNREYEEIPLEACEEYVTLLNLRTWGKIDGRYVTEQVYIHTKLMIVDDLYALVGSANINDRSLLGARDSEIAVLVMDGETSRKDVNGAGSQRPVRAFAHNLRKTVWNKLFGITGDVRPANSLKQAIEQPGIPDSWRSIQKVAKKNSELYEAAFRFIPRSVSPFRSGGPAQILPVFDRTTNALDEPMPFQAEFWSQKQSQGAEFTKLDGVQGFITALPIGWTKGENNRIMIPSSAVVHVDPAKLGLPQPVMTSKKTQDESQEPARA